MHEIIKYLNYEMFRKYGLVPDPYKITIIKNVNTNIIINPSYLAHPEDLAILAHLMNERPWDVLCRDALYYSK